MSSHVIVDEEDCLDIIDQMRISIPEELREAKRILQERQRILNQSQEEAKRVVALAREEASHQLDQHVMVKDAHTRGQAALDQARREAEMIRLGADEYAVEVLERLERILAPILSEVHNGLASLREVSSEPEGERAHGLTGDDGDPIMKA